jgi:Tfp pilus assembly protein PilO
MKFRVVYLWFGLPVLIVVFWLLAFYAPMAAAINGQRKELLSVQKERQTIDRALRDIIEARKKDARARSSLEGSFRNIPLYSHFPGVIRMVAQTAKREGIVIDALDTTMIPNEPQQPNALTKPTLDMALKGRFLDMGRFLEDIQKQSGFKRIDEARISYNDKEYPVLTGRFLVEFRAWRGNTAFENK